MFFFSIKLFKKVLVPYGFIGFGAGVGAGTIGGTGAGTIGGTGAGAGAIIIGLYVYCKGTIPACG